MGSNPPRFTTGKTNQNPCKAWVKAVWWYGNDLREKLLEETCQAALLTQSALGKALHIPGPQFPLEYQEEVELHP